MKPTVAAVVERWHQGLQQGEDVSAEELCRECPELLPDVRTILNVTRVAMVSVPDKLLAERSLQSITRRLGFNLTTGELGSLGDYRLIRILGQGGMGVVFEAEDPKLSRRVALKVLRPEIASDPVHRERFLREARNAATLQNDHIIPIFGVGECEEMPYLIMPLLTGQSLACYLSRKGSLPWNAIVRVARDTARGLAAAHARGVVHRDIKPANLWLEASKPFRVRILDFGIARSSMGDDSVTQTGQVVGTPAYMSPEQARGEPPDPRSDLFSLGCVLYHCATGKSPFDHSNLTATLTALAIDQPLPPRQLNAAIPQGLNDLILRLLAKNPQHRPASATELLADLANESMSSSKSMSRVVPLNELEPEATIEVSPSRGRRVQWSIAIGLGLLLLLGLLWIALDRDGRSTPPPPPPAPQTPADLEPLPFDLLKKKNPLPFPEEKKKSFRPDPRFDNPPPKDGPRDLKKREKGFLPPL